MDAVLQCSCLLCTHLLVRVLSGQLLRAAPYRRSLHPLLLLTRTAHLGAPNRSFHGLVSEKVEDGAVYTLHCPDGRVYVGSFLVRFWLRSTRRDDWSGPRAHHLDLTTRFLTIARRTGLPTARARSPGPTAQGVRQRAQMEQPGKRVEARHDIPDLQQQLRAGGPHRRRRPSSPLRRPFSHETPSLT